jgi:hypothetical protein
MTQKPIFFYGPTGNGKTSVAVRLFRVYQDAVLIPYALEFDGQIIVLYDPTEFFMTQLFTESLTSKAVMIWIPAGRYVDVRVL